MRYAQGGGLTDAERAARERIRLQAVVRFEGGETNREVAVALRALEQLRTTWYATGMERVREVRRALVPWRHEPCVRDLDDQLCGWETTVSALAR